MWERQVDDTTQAYSFHEIQKLFSNDEVCRNHLFHLRWPDGYVCSVCGSNQYDAQKKRQLLQCRNCIDQERFKSPLKKMTHPFLLLIDVARVTKGEILHYF